MKDKEDTLGDETRSEALDVHDEIDYDELMNEESHDEKGNNKLQSGQDSGAIKALFGALYTLAKEKVTDSNWVAMVNVIVDFILILVIFLHLEYPWAIDPDNVVFKIFFWLEIQRPLAARGLDFYEVIFYLVCGILYLSVAICAWVAWCFKNDSFPFLWPIKFVRIVASIFFGTFYIASLNIFLTMAECIPPYSSFTPPPKSNSTFTYYSGSSYSYTPKSYNQTTYASKSYNQTSYSTSYAPHRILASASDSSSSSATLIHHIYHTSCFEMPLLIHVIIALVSSVVFACVALLLVMADHELKPLSDSLLAAPHSMTELKSTCVKTIITAVDVLMTPWIHAQAVIFLIVCLLNVWWHMAQLPYYTAWMNCFRCALYSVHAWICICLVALVFRVSATRDKTATTNGVIYWYFENGSYAEAQTITMTMFYGIAPAFILGGIAAFVRLGYFFRIALRFSSWNPDLKSKKIIKFASETDVEVTSRVLRAWDEDEIPDPAALDLGEKVIKGGLQQFPNSPFMRIVYANFLIGCREQMQSGWAQLELARKMHPNLSYRFSIFTWEQEHKQKAVTSSTGNNAATDLVSYVEFQKNYKSLMMYHKAALLATRNFWRLVNNDAISLVTLSEAFGRIDFMKNMADKTYKLVLEKYPNSVKLLRAYAGYLETVNNDPWSASKYYTMADKHEEDQENAAQDVVILTEDGRPLIDTKGSAVVTINSIGIIQSANKAANAMFGYQRGDLEKRNIKMLMPQPFSGRHDQFLANYQNTGKAKILDSQREVLGQHKENFVFPIRITVTRSSGAGADSIFMGVLKAVESDKTIIRAWLLPSGTVLCVDQNFIDYAGWASKDLLGHAFAALATDDALVGKMIKEAASMSEQELAEGAVTASTFIKHKFADDVPVAMKFEMGGTRDQRLLVVTMKRTAPTEALAVFDHKSNLIFSNSVFASMLGYESSKIAGKDISMFIEQPFGFLHRRWIKEQDGKVTKPSPGGCRSGLPFKLLTSSGTHVAAKLAITPKEAGDHYNFCLKVESVDHHEKDDMRRLSIRVNKEGEIVSVSHSPLQLFDFLPSALLGHHIHEAIDLFNQWQQQGEDCLEALEALMIYTEANKGASWRVGVLPSFSEDLDTAQNVERQESTSRAPSAGLVRSSSKSRKISSKLMSSIMKPRPAVMQVIRLKGGSDAVQFGLNDGGESLRSHRGDDAVVEIKLWRPDMLSGVLEVDRDLKIIKGDISAAAVFGRSLPQMFGRNLRAFLKPLQSSAITVKELMGIRASKAGGVKKKHPVVGPKRQFEGLHSDGLPLTVTLQMALKNGVDENKMVALVKCVSTALGDCSFLDKLLYGDIELNAVRGQASLLKALSSSNLDVALAATQAPPAQQKSHSPVPPLNIASALSELHPDNMTARESAKSHQRATARDVAVDLDPQPHGHHIVLRSVPELQDLDPQPLAHHAHPRPSGGSRLIHVSSPTTPPHDPHADWDHIHHVDPDYIPVPDDADYEIEDHQIVPEKDDMSVSRDDESEEKGKEERVVKRLESLRQHEFVRKRTFDELAPQEQTAMRRSIVLVQRWLDSDYQATLPQDGVTLTACQVPDLLPSKRDEPAPVHLRAGPPHAAIARQPSPPEAFSPDDEKKEEVNAVEPHEANEEAVPKQPELTVSDFDRGKRLKRLNKLLSGRQATRALTRLRLQGYLLLGSVLALHITCFVVVLISTYKQYSYVSNISSAGQAIVKTHLVATYNRDIEAAIRGVGLNLTADMKYLYSQLSSHLDLLQDLHHGLYLGFNGKPTSQQQRFSSFWTVANFPATQFDSSIPPKNSSILMSLWDLGGIFISSGRQVGYIAQQAAIGNVSSSVSSDRFWLFVRDNGAASLYQGYLQVLDQMLLQAQDETRSLKTLLIALLVLETILVLIGATGYILWLLVHVAKSRAALFTVFLFVPSGLLKSLATQSVVLADPDADPDDQPKPKKIEVAQEAPSPRMISEGKRKSLVLDNEGMSDVNGQAMIDAPRAPKADAPRAPKAVRDHEGKRRASITWVEDKEDTGNPASPTKDPGLVPRSHSFGGQYKRQVSGEIDIKQGIFNGKKLIEIWRDVYRLSWPFIAWGLLILASYIICLYLTNSVTADLVNLKLQSRSMGQASRVLFYSNEVSLMNASDPLLPQRQAALAKSASDLQTIHRVALFGGPTLNDSAANGAKDDSSGGIFAANSDRVNLFFKAKGCLLSDNPSSFLGLPTSSPPCLDDTSMFYQAATHAIDPMMHRLALNGQMMALDSSVNVAPSGKPYWLFSHSVARLDLIQGLQTVLNLYSSDVIKEFEGAQWTMIAVFIIIFLSMIAYVFVCLNPFLEMSFAECEAVAAMLAQLPSDLDVEEMVTASYNLVLEHQLDKKALHVKELTLAEKSGLSRIWSKVRLMSNVSALMATPQPGAVDEAGGPLGPGANRRGSLLSLIGAAQMAAARKSIEAASGRLLSNRIVPISDPNDLEMQRPLPSLSPTNGHGGNGIGSHSVRELLLSNGQLSAMSLVKSMDLPLPPRLDPFASTLYHPSQALPAVQATVPGGAEPSQSPEPPIMVTTSADDQADRVSELKTQAMEMAYGHLTNLGLKPTNSPARHKPLISRDKGTGSKSADHDQVLESLLALMGQNESGDESK